MNPQTVKKLKENVPELRELIAYLVRELAKCDTLDGLAALSFNERAYETSVRIRMKARITEILAPLVEDVTAISGIDPTEYVA